MSDFYSNVYGLIVNENNRSHKLSVISACGIAVCWVSQEQGEKFRLLAEIVVDGVNTFSIPNGAAFMSNVRLDSQCKSCQTFRFCHSFSFYRLFHFERLVVIICFVSNIYMIN